jgi:hypothetical protein
MSDKRIRIPAAAELIDAVAGFLEQELLPTLEGSKRFNTRVSVNALRIVQRELGRPAQDEAALLDLAERIRSGTLDESDPKLLAELRRYALERLAVENPRYSSYLAARDRK